MNHIKIGSQIEIKSGEHAGVQAEVIANCSADIRVRTADGREIWIRRDNAAVVR